MLSGVNMNRWLSLSSALTALAGCGSEVRYERLEHQDGLASPCAGVTCSAPGPCVRPGVCDPDQGVCVYEQVDDATPCDDGNACTYGDACNDGACKGGKDVVCRPADACHTGGTCDPQTGCQMEARPDGTACEDGNPCTGGDVCSSGTCAGTPKQCATPGQCVTGVCNGATGECDTLPVPDGMPCTQAASAGMCEELTCVAGECDSTPKLCAAIDDCHAAGTCDPSTGVCSTPTLADGTTCDDGQVCTAGDQCEAGACKSGAPLVCPNDPNPCFAAPECLPGVGCVRSLAPNGVLCDDGNACTGTDRCFFGECQGADEVKCAPLDACHLVGVCDQATGLCSSPPVPGGSACDDGNACTYGTTCNAGNCSGGEIVTCVAAKICQLTPVCDTLLGCVYENSPNDTPCEDGDLCSGSDSCQVGECVPGTAVVCSPTGDPCTSSGCDQETGACALIPLGSSVSCNDGHFCTNNDHCDAGQCVGGSQLYCPSRECIATPICSPADGSCGGVPEPDGTSCELEQPDPCSAESTCSQGLCRVSTRVTCTPLNTSYGSGVCDSATGDCTNPCKNVGAYCTGGYCFTDVTYSFFVDVTPIAGMVSGPAAGAVLDFDLDGWTDILMTTNAGGLLLLHNNRTGFSDVTAAAGLTGTSNVTGVVVADYNNDGLPDVYVLTSGQNQLYRNLGTGGARNFSVVTLENPAGNGYSTDAAFGDYDNDGRLDVFVTNSGPDAAHPLQGAVNQMYRFNSGNGSFEDVAVTLGFTDALISEAVLLTDATGDGLLDILEGNQTAVRLYQQAATGHTFAAPTTAVDLGASGRCEGLSSGDYDRDGDLDYYVANAATLGANGLLKNSGGSFSNDATTRGAAVTQDGCDTSLNPSSWDSVFADFNADGALDIFVANGASSGTLPLGNALLTRSSTAVNFSNVAANARADDSRRARAVLMLDYDNDGDHDLFVINEQATAQLLRNDHNDRTTPGSYVRLVLVGSRSNRDALGAKVSVTSGTTVQTVERNRATRGDGRMLFGVPAGGNVDLLVKWPSGTIQRRFGIPSAAFVESDVVDGFNPPKVTLNEPAVTPVYDTYLWTDVLDSESNPVSSTVEVDLALVNASTLRTVQVDVVLRETGGAFTKTQTVSIGAGANTSTPTTVTFSLTEIKAGGELPVELTVTVTDGTAINQIREFFTLVP